MQYDLHDIKIFLDCTVNHEVKRNVTGRQNVNVKMVRSDYFASGVIRGSCV